VVEEGSLAFTAPELNFSAADVLIQVGVLNLLYLYYKVY
jgi:hypothetical protein